MQKLIYDTNFNNFLNRVSEDLNLNIVNHKENLTTTGTSIVSHFTDKGLMISSDLQASIVQIGVKMKIKEKVSLVLKDDPNRYLLALAGVAQLQEYLLKSINAFHQWYTENFLTQPALATIVCFLKNLHQKNGWNYYSHIILGGLCPRENIVNMYSLCSGDIINAIEDRQRYLTLGSGSKYLLGRLSEPVAKPWHSKLIKDLLISAINSAKSNDLFSGKGIKLYELDTTKNLITVLDISMADYESLDTSG
jgi:20S proteasome alpha/beta subunit